MWSDTMYDTKVVDSGYEPGLEKSMVGSHSFDLLVSDGVKGAAIEVINQRQDHEMIKTDQKKNMKRSKRLRKAKEKWNTSEDRQKDVWSEEEDHILIEAHKVVGNKWSKISRELPGRSENDIKNHWNAAIRRADWKKTKQIDENASMPQDSILKNYIRCATINNKLRKDTEIAGNTKNSKNIFDGKMNMSLDDTNQTVKPWINASTSSTYGQEPAMFSCDDYFTKVCESMGDIEMLMDGWE
ncbi:unnamed protein product [Microthlaspi erraticum]|uniref:Uncharacterized protein n=1 Tax=Microthlaspi erraticum TaxID=1685480 RepID=A0A6D2JXC0_9BRAS|nr:unnamed protein product [Microthlaspi erraticum]